MPNILLMTADNLGYGDLRCYNASSRIISPYLDRLAAEGVRLTDFYTASPTCSVSRASLLTGRIPQRHGLIDQLAGIDGNYGTGLRQSETLIPQVLKRASSPYATGCFGKWNIGFAEGSRPTDRGFDEFVGHVSGNMDYYHHIYNGRHDLYQGTQELHADGSYSTDLFADAAIDFIQRHSKAGQSWFCYLPFNAPHFPNRKNKRPGQPDIWQAPAVAFEKYGWKADESDPRRRYEVVVTAMDDAIGRVLRSLDESGVSDNTFVFFMSDNGAFRLNRDGLDVGENTPLRSGGVTCWEGGLRVAAMARWPGRIPPGTVCSEVLWSCDLLATCAGLAQVELSETLQTDGHDMTAVLRGESRPVHRSLVFQYRTHAALRMEKWKIVREKATEPWQLFDLSSDIGETRDVSSANALTVQALDQEFRKWNDQKN
ncbi:MAG: sulfatase-like hydrolase/transferase [Planctomycetaceae bacterium]